MAQPRRDLKSVWYFICLVLTKVVPLGVAALELRTGTYWSASLGQDQSYGYYLPCSSSCDSGQRFPLYLLLHGRDGGWRDWPTCSRISRYAAAYSLCIVFFDGANGWYTNASDGKARYEDALIDDFVPHLQATLPLLPPGSHWGIGGASMGGYGAIKTALRHPDLFLLGVSHSGAFEASTRPTRHPVFGDPEEDRAIRRGANVFRLAEDTLSQNPVCRPRLYFDCGADDPLCDTNRRLHDHLNFIGYNHTYCEMPGYHTWPYFNRAARTALPVVAEMLGG